MQMLTAGWGKSALVITKQHSFTERPLSPAN